MLVIPIFNKPGSKIPYICIALIAINVFIYFFVQSGDNVKRQEAYEYYETSHLMAIEADAFRDYLVTKGEILPEEDVDNEQTANQLIARMFADREFYKLLTENRIIQPGNPQFKEWRDKRDHFEGLDQTTIIYSYGYSPERGNLLGLFTCTFLHGGIMHLVGNMVFLWFVGAILEKAIGSILFILLYLITGICASGLFGLVYPLSPGPLVGASGAIAGLMGAYGVIFTFRKIRVFWSIGFYFDYANIPAILLFPIWLINELVQLGMSQNSHVAYMAHIGGLLSGIAIGTGYRFSRKEGIESLFLEEEQNNELELLQSSGMEKLLALKLDEARRDFCKVLELEPGNRVAIQQLYTIDKTRPESNNFHNSAHRLLKSLQNENQSDYLKLFEEYRTTTRKPRVPIDILERLAHYYLSAGDLKKGSACLATLIKRTPENIKIPGFLMTLASAYKNNNNKEQAEKCYKLLASNYAISVEGIAAAEFLKRH